jgi:hypothetical protein
MRGRVASAAVALHPRLMAAERRRGASAARSGGGSDHPDFARSERISARYRSSRSLVECVLVSFQGCGCGNAVIMAAARSSWQRIWQQCGPSWQQHDRGRAGTAQAAGDLATHVARPLPLGTQL